MNILITGSSGIIGSFLTDFLSKNHIVFGLSRKNSDFNYDLLKITDQEITDILKKNKIDLIIHCAAVINLKNLNDYRLNSIVLGKFFTNKIGREKKYLVIGSAAEYGLLGVDMIGEDSLCSPVNLYGESKLMQTMFCEYHRRIFGIDVSVLRLFNIISPHLNKKTLFGSILDKIGDNREIVVPNLKIERDFLDIRDFAGLIEKIAEKPLKSFLYNVGSGLNVSYEQVFCCFDKILIENKRSTLCIKESNKNELCSNAKCDITKIKRELNWVPKYELLDSVDWCLKEKGIIS